MKRYLLKITSILIILTVILSPGCRKNHPPHTPYTPSGPSVGIVDKKYNFSSLTIDPEGDSITMRFDWGDGDTSVWLSDLDIWVASEQTFTLSHSWSVYDTYYIRAQAMDKLGAISNWSLPISIAIVEKEIRELTWICATNSAGWSPRESHASVVFNNKMWVIGGFGWLPGWYECHDIWNSTDGINWTCVTDSAEFVGDDTRAVVFDNKIWVIGGTEQMQPRNDVWCSQDGVNWTQATASAQWSPRACHTVVVFDNKIWVYGGIDSILQVLNDVWFSTDGINWTCVINSTEFAPRIEPAVVAFNNKIWIMGGEYSGGCLNDVWYSADGRAWFRATASAAWQERYYHPAVVFDNKMWVLGGIVRDVGNSNDVWYSTDGEFWTCATSLTIFPKRSDHAAVVFDNKIWVMGGFGPRPGVILNDVWYGEIVHGKK